MELIAPIRKELERSHIAVGSTIDSIIAVQGEIPEDYVVVDYEKKPLKEKLAYLLEGHISFFQTNFIMDILTKLCLTLGKDE